MVKSVRSTRSRPDLGAPLSNSRRALYAAALEQYEELLDAAGRVSLASRPLLLFYAIGQAGRAIAASRLARDWQPSGHGLRLSVNHRAPMTSEIRPIGGSSLFQAVALAIGSAVPTRPCSIRTIWASILECSPYSLDDVLEPRPLEFWGDWFDSKPPFVRCRVVVPDAMQPRGTGTDISPEGLERVSDYLSHYPTLSGWELAADFANPANIDRDEGWVIELRVPVGNLGGLTEGPAPRWKGFYGRLVEIARPSHRVGEGHVYPAVGGEVMHPLLSWWMMLFAMSMMVRYHPRTWAQLIDVDKSINAVPLEHGLSHAEWSIPDLIFECLSGRVPWDRGS